VPPSLLTLELRRQRLHPRHIISPSSAATAMSSGTPESLARCRQRQQPGFVAGDNVKIWRPFELLFKHTAARAKTRCCLKPARKGASVCSWREKTMHLRIYSPWEGSGSSARNLIYFIQQRRQPLSNFRTLLLLTLRAAKAVWHRKATNPERVSKHN
jgi:hypothetical protein